MNRLATLCVCAVIFGVRSVAQIRVSVPIDPEGAGQVALVQSTRASVMEKELPEVSLSDWLLAEAGPDAKIAWSYDSSHDWNNWNDTRHVDCGHVYADVRTWDDRAFVVSIATGGACNVPVFVAGWVRVNKKGAADTKQLSDLPRLLWTRKTSQRREAKR